MKEMTITQTNSIANIGEGPSVLGQSQASIPIGGKIRAGIMVLTKASQSNKQAVKIYNEGVAAGKAFNIIGSELHKATNGSAKLTPKNAPYFTVRESDFNIPGSAKIMMDTFAEDRGDGNGRQLYSFPILFPVDNWQAVMPHLFECFTAGERKYWSEYDQDGNRKCMTMQEVKAGHRPAGGRLVIPRKENNGLCNPDVCPEYQQKKCTMSGKFIFYVPGIAGASAIALPTRSIYSMIQARQQMEMVAFITGGKISGTWHGKPIFHISKKLEKVSMIDQKTGKAKRVGQYLISLDANVDMSEMFKQSESPALLKSGQQAAAALGHDVEEFDDDIFIDGDVVSEESHDVGQPVNEPAQVVTQKPEPETAAPDEVALMKKIAEAKSQDELTDVAAVLPEMTNKAAIKRVREAMSARYKELN